MKQTILVTMLLGFGALMPSTCSKSKTSKDAAQIDNQSCHQPAAKQTALYGPVVKVAAQSKV
jgi:hypothetical protein